ncbi:7078_t:CDS:2, partial [Funneliformis geosporum]
MDEIDAALDFRNVSIVTNYRCYRPPQYVGLEMSPTSDRFQLNNILWKEKIKKLVNITIDLKTLHKLGYCHKDFHSGNILQDERFSYISDFGLTGPADKQKSDDRIYGVLPYIAPEVLNGEPYTLASDIYSFGVIMAEYSSGNPPFYDRKHDYKLSLDICNGLRPDFGKGTPKFYKKLAYRCMNANPNQRPSGDELKNTLSQTNPTEEGERTMALRCHVNIKRNSVVAIIDTGAA